MQQMLPNDPVQEPPVRPPLLEQTLELVQMPDSALAVVQDVPSSQLEIPEVSAENRVFNPKLVKEFLRDGDIRLSGPTICHEISMLK